jgi:hypothetical protein
MHYRKLIFRPALLYRRRLDNVPALFVYIQFYQAIILLILVLDQIEFILVQPVDVPDVPEPGVQQAHVFGCHCGFDAAAAVVPANNDVFYFQVAHGIVDDGHDVEVDVVDEVGDVAVDEHFAGFETGDGFGGDAGVGAACEGEC